MNWQKIDAILYRLLQVGVVAILIGIPAYPKFPLISVPGTYVSIRIEDFLILTIGAIWLLYLRQKIFDLLKLRITQAILLFLAVGLLSLLSALFLTQTVSVTIGALHTIRRFEYLAVFFFAYSSIKSRQDVYFYLKVITLTALLVFIYAVGQKLFAWPIISTMNKEYSQGVAQAVAYGGRINSTFAGHYDLAAYAVVIINLFFGILAGVKKWSNKLVYLGMVSISLWLLLASSSRISFAAYLGSVTLGMILMRKWWWIIPVLAISIMSSFYGTTMNARYADSLKYEILPRLAAIEYPWERGETVAAPTTTPTPTPVVIADKPSTVPGGVNQPTPTPAEKRLKKSLAGTEIEYVQLPEDRSTAIRFNVEWPRALRAFQKNPLLGTGYSSITLATDNDYLRALGEVGFLGFMAFMLIFVTMFNDLKAYLFKGSPDFKHAVIIGFAAATIGFLANALFIDVFEASKVAIFYWILSGIIIRYAHLNDAD